MKQMKVIGLTGNIGGGKTTVANMLQENYQAYVIFSDLVAKKLMEPGQISYLRIVEEFGLGILDDKKRIDRNKLAEVVFGDHEKLSLLNSLTHPYVEECILEDIKRVRESGKYKYAVVETALLYQVHYDRFCDVVWVVIAEDEIRRQRLKDSRGYSDEKIDAILENQMTNDEFRRRTTYIIENSGDLNNIDKQLQNMLECL